MDLAESIGLLLFSERDAEGNPLLEEDETLLSKFERLQLILGTDADQGEGTLFVTPSRVVWMSSQDATRGYSVDFTAVGMHAVMTDPQSVEKPCLYIQLDQDEEEGYYGAGDGAEGSVGSSGEEDEGEGRPLPELRLIPADPSTLEEVFQAFCDGAARNPDFEAEAEGEGELFCDEDEVLAGATQAGTRLNEVEEIVQGDLDRFEDAEDEGNTDDDGPEEADGEGQAQTLAKQGN